ncbi:MAG: hypothetical protein OHK0046_02110 [Anaerolineae bacterium]
MLKNVFLVLLFLLSFQVMTLRAQDTPIEYGQFVTGEITNREFEVSYTFTGDAGQVVVIEMKPVDTLGDLNSPELLLIDAEGQLISSTVRTLSVLQAVLVAELPANGEYIIIATRRDGRAGDSVGEYTLELILAEQLMAGEALAGQLSSEGRSQYYSVNSEREFQIQYQKTSDGELSPQITVNLINEDGIDEVASVEGDSLSIALLGNFAPAAPYLIIVGRPLFYFSINEELADYELTFIQIDA